MNKGILFTCFMLLSILVQAEHLVGFDKCADADNPFAIRVVASIATLYIPDAVKELCNITTGNPELCEVVYESSKALVELRGKKIYKGVTKGLKWVVRDYSKYRTLEIETNTYSNAKLIKSILEKYNSQKCMNWSSVGCIDCLHDVAWNVKPDHYTGYLTGELLDSRDGRKYKIALVNDKIWIAEPISFKPRNTAVHSFFSKLEVLKNNKLNSGYRKPCPKNWEIPDMDDYKELLLVNDLSDNSKAGTRISEDRYYDLRSVGFFKDHYKYTFSGKLEKTNIMLNLWITSYNWAGNRDASILRIDHYGDRLEAHLSELLEVNNNPCHCIYK